jgi:hypothetical protein
VVNGDCDFEDEMAGRGGDDPPKEESPQEWPTGPVTRMFQVPEPDLEYLEREIPKLCDFNSMSCNNPAMRLKWNRIKEIVSNIRWNYGPPTQVERIPAGDE